MFREIEGGIHRLELKRKWWKLAKTQGAKSFSGGGN